MDDLFMDDLTFQLYTRVIRAAMRSDTIHYGDLAEGTGLSTRGHRLGQELAPYLGRISLYEWQHGRPLLTVLVVRKDTGLPGADFFNLARHLGAMQEGEAEEAFTRRHTAEVRKTWAIWTGAGA